MIVIEFITFYEDTVDFLMPLAVSADYFLLFYGVFNDIGYWSQLLLMLLDHSTLSFTKQICRLCLNNIWESRFIFSSCGLLYTSTIEWVLFR